MHSVKPIVMVSSRYNFLKKKGGCLSNKLYLLYFEMLFSSKIFHKHFFPSKTAKRNANSCIFMEFNRWWKLFLDASRKSFLLYLVTFRYTLINHVQCTWRWSGWHLNCFEDFICLCFLFLFFSLIKRKL